MKAWRVALVAAVAFLVAGANQATPPQQPAGGLLTEADSYIKAEMKNRGIPGLAVAVVHDGRTVATQAYGLADLDLNVPVTLDSVFPIASLDKQLTASGIMMLVQGEKVRLDDEISSYIADRPVPMRKSLRHCDGGKTKPRASQTAISLTRMRARPGTREWNMGLRCGPRKSGPCASAAQMRIIGSLCNMKTGRIIAAGRWRRRRILSRMPSLRTGRHGGRVSASAPNGSDWENIGWMTPIRCAMMDSAS